MSGIPSDVEILAALDHLDTHTAEDLETQWLEFKPWQNAKDAQAVAVEYAVCFANTEGGAIVFGVSDQVRGRANAIHGAHRYAIDRWRRGIHDATRPALNVDVVELRVPEGTLLVVRVPRGDTPPYGTSAGLFKRRVDKHCLPIDAADFVRARVRSGALDWSGEAADGVTIADLDPVEIARARNVLQSHGTDSGLLRMNEEQFLQGVEAVRNGKVTNAGLLLFGRTDVLRDACPQHQVHYVLQRSTTEVTRNDVRSSPLLNVLQTVESAFVGPANPESELSVGFISIRIPAFPQIAVREAVMNALVHRDYSNPDEILIRHTPRELVITSPGGFVGGITAQNILRHEPVARNRTLANAFLKLRLVESAGVGRRRIFESLLRFGKRPPLYTTDGDQVTLTMFDGAYDEKMAGLVAQWQREGREIDLDALLILTFLKEQRYIDSTHAAELLQLPRDHAMAILDRLSDPDRGILERRGETRTATFHLTKHVAKILLSKAAYTRTRGIDRARYAEMVRQYVIQHGSITPAEIRGLLGLGDSQSARVQTSRMCREWSGPSGFLRLEGTTPRHRYVLR